MDTSPDQTLMEHQSSIREENQGDFEATQPARQSASSEKRTRTNYGLTAHKVKIEDAVKVLLESVANGQKVNVRAISEARGIPYNTLRDHFKKAQGLMAPPKRTSFNYPMADYKEPPTAEHRLQTVVTSDNSKPFVYDIRKRGRKPALPKLIESQLKTFVIKMNSIGLAVDRTQLKQVSRQPPFPFPIKMPI